jgi:hypothetical protein
MVEIRGNVLGKIMEEIKKRDDCEDIYFPTEKAVVRLGKIEARFTTCVSLVGWKVTIEVSPRHTERDKKLCLSGIVEIEEKADSIAVPGLVEPVISKFEELLSDMRKVISALAK